MPQEADYIRVLSAISGEEFLPTYAIADKIGSQDNSVQRAIHKLRHDQPWVTDYVIEKKPNPAVKGGVMYRAAPRSGQRKVHWKMSQARCKCGSWYKIIIDGSWVCNNAECRTLAN